MVIIYAIFSTLALILHMIKNKQNLSAEVEQNLIKGSWYKLKCGLSELEGDKASYIHIFCEGERNSQSLVIVGEGPYGVPPVPRISVQRNFQPNLKGGALGRNF